MDKRLSAIALIAMIMLGLYVSCQKDNEQLTFDDQLVNITKSTGQIDLIDSVADLNWVLQSEFNKTWISTQPVLIQDDYCSGALVQTYITATFYANTDAQIIDPNNPNDTLPLFNLRLFHEDSIKTVNNFPKFSASNIVIRNGDIRLFRDINGLLFAMYSNDGLNTFTFKTTHPTGDKLNYTQFTNDITSFLEGHWVEVYRDSIGYVTGINCATAVYNQQPEIHRTLDFNNGLLNITENAQLVYSDTIDFANSLLLPPFYGCGNVYQERMIKKRVTGYYVDGVAFLGINIDVNNNGQLELGYFEGFEYDVNGVTTCETIYTRYIKQ